MTSSPLYTATTYADGVVYLGDLTTTYAVSAANGGVLGTVPVSGQYDEAAMIPVNGALLVDDGSHGALTRYTPDAGTFSVPVRPSPSALRPDGRLALRR